MLLVPDVYDIALENNGISDLVEEGGLSCGQQYIFFAIVCTSRRS